MKFNRFATRCGSFLALIFFVLSCHGDTDGVQPEISSDISFSNISSTAVRISWDAATDDESPQTALEYKIIISSSAEAIDTINEANGITGDDLISDWTADLITTTISSLTPNTIYYVAVLVRDEAGNITLYPPQAIGTLDESSPTIDGNISFSSITATSFTASWTAATDDVSGSSALEYRVVKGSSASSIDTLVEVEAVTGDDLAIDWTANITTADFSGLDSSTTYFVSVLVRDEAGNLAIYSPQSVSTLDISSPTINDEISISSITSSSFTVTWDAATDDVSAEENLEYKVVQDSQASNIDTIEEAEEMADGNLLMDWTANITTVDVSDLDSSTTYYIAVLVRDEAGNMAVYSPEAATTLDVTAPTIGTAISFSSTTTSSTTVNWGEANDDISETESLEYLVVMSTDSGEIDTIAEAEAIIGDSLILDWTPNTTTIDVTGLDSGTGYYFAVLVRDESGNIAIYTPQMVSTSEDPGPSAGTGIVFSSTGYVKAQLTWGAASDSETDVSALEYKLVRSTSSAGIDTVEEADAISGGDLVMDWTAATTSRTASDLTPNTSYYFAVLVRDEDDNMALYTPQNTTTLNGKRVFKSASTHDGNFGGISGADSACNADSNKPATDTYMAFMTDGTTRVACTSSNCSSGGATENLDWVLAPSTTYVRADDDTVIATTTTSAIFSFSLTNNFASLGAEIWTGMTTSWISTSDCTDWSTTSGTGSVGGSNNTSSSILRIYNQNCNRSDVSFMCIEQ